MKKSAIIIGAGIGGIAIAIRLAVKGYQVTILESNSYPGGKLAEIKYGEYRFDAGPSLLTMPNLIDELFILAGRIPHQHFQYKKLDEICRYFYDDGTTLTAHSDIDLFSKEIEQKTGVLADKIKRHLERSKEMYNLTEKLFLQSSLHKTKSYLNVTSIKALLKLGKLKTSQIMHDENHKAFNNSKITQLFDRYATYNGSDPYKCPATLNIIPHLEYNLGAYFPVNGMYSIVTSLVESAYNLGITIKYNSKVEEIIVSDNVATGVISEKEIYKADLIISNADINSTYRKMLKNFKAPENILNQEKSSSGLVFYWGVKGNFKNLGLHNIFFANDYKKEFESLFDLNIPYNDPTIYLNISSKENKKDAPEGHENWFVMINVPPDHGQNWKEFIAISRANIVKKLEKHLKMDLATIIQTEQILDPKKIEQQTSAFKGALYGNSSNSKYAAFLRHPNFSGKIKNLYFCGGSVHPGGGIPLCLNSAKIVSDLIG